MNWKLSNMKTISKVLIIVLLGAVGMKIYAQQKLGSSIPTSPTSINDTTNKFMLLARVALRSVTDQSTISTGVGLQVYNTACTKGKDRVSPGFYTWDGNIWVRQSQIQDQSKSNIRCNSNENRNFQRNNKLIGILDSDDGNTCFGTNSLKNVTIGVANTALGYNALLGNLTGSQNTAVGYYALKDNSTGSQNVGVGQGVLFSNTGGSNNTAIGLNVLFGNTTGMNNTALGHAALTANSTGISNTAVGQAALQNSTGSNNTAIGGNADVDKAVGDNCIAIGFNATTGDNSDCVRIGNKMITSIGGQVAWSVYSDMRVVEITKDNVPGLDFIVKLKPVSYHFDSDAQDSIMGTKTDASQVKIDGSKRAEASLHSGFIAQDVEETLKMLGYKFDVVVKPQNSTDIYSLSYELLTVPLVKAVQEQQRNLKKQQVDIDMLQRLIQYQQQQIEELKKALEVLLKKNKMIN